VRKLSLKIKIELSPDYHGDEDSVMENIDAKVRSYIEGSMVNRGRVVSIKRMKS